MGHTVTPGNLFGPRYLRAIMAVSIGDNRGNCNAAFVVSPSPGNGPY